MITNGPERMKQRMIPLLLIAVLAAPGLIAAAGEEKVREYGDDPIVGVEENLGGMVPLDLRFCDEEGNEVALSDLVKRPTVLMLVYFRCRSICIPVMDEMARTLDEIDIEPGIDFDVFTVSFDIDDTPETARNMKEKLLASMDRKIPPNSWRFLTGEKDDIMSICDAVGFRFRREGPGFNHAGTIMFLSPEGEIVRYLPGLEILPADMKMAVIDAAEGNPRSFIQKIQRLCYSFDPEGRTYVLQVNRIVLGVTLFFVAAFLVFILLKGRRKKAQSLKEDLT